MCLKWAFISVQNMKNKIYQLLSVKLFFGQERNIFMTFSRNSPSTTMTSNLTYEAGDKVLPKPHPYSPESDLVSCEILTATKYCPDGDLPSFLMLYLSLWALRPVVSMRTFSCLHSPLQKYILLPENLKVHVTPTSPPSVPVTMRPEVPSCRAVEKMNNH